MIKSQTFHLKRTLYVLLGIHGLIIMRLSHHLKLTMEQKKEYLSYDKIFLSDYKNLVLSLYKAGFEYKKDTISPQGVVHGHISTHEEIFSIRDMLTYKHYSPTAHFVYSPCEYAKKSLENINYNNPTKFHIIKNLKS